MQYRNALSAGLVPRGQFFHVEKYAREAWRGKRGGYDIEKIAGEADRLPGYHRHIEASKVRRPVVLFGTSMSQAMKRSVQWAEAQMTTYTDARGDQRERRLRSDHPCAAVGVVSFPRDYGDEAWQRYKQVVLAWLKLRYEDRLTSVIEHTDESNPHLHFWVVPRVDEDFTAVHPGLDAEKRLGTQATRLEKRTAYVTAMRALQDDFHREVSDQFGLSRVSVKGRRMPRPEYLAFSEERKRLRALEDSLAEDSARRVEERRLKQDEMDRQTAMALEDQMMAAMHHATLDAIQQQPTRAGQPVQRLSSTSEMPNVHPPLAKGRELHPVQIMTGSTAATATVCPNPVAPKKQAAAANVPTMAPRPRPRP